MVRKICVFVGGRANYSSIKSALKAIDNHPELELQLVVGASALLEKYGKVVDLIEKDGFKVAKKVNMILEGETPETMAKSTGIGLSELATTFGNLKPDFVVVIGDRYEIMSAAIAAVYMNISLAHTMGGEVTGTIDESIRHALTKLAHVHFPANKDAAKRIEKMGEENQNIFITGCPRIDEVYQIANDGIDLKNDIFELYGGVGEKFDINDPFLLVSQHPVTTEYDDSENQINQTLTAVKELGMPAIMLWPNSDAGSDGISKGIRKFREKHPDNKIHFFKNLPMEVYIKLMVKSKCLIGNSSSGIRDGESLGAGCVNVGTRQAGRERGKNVIDVDYNKDQIIEAIKTHIKNGKYKTSNIYGDGKAGEKIAEVLSSVNVKQQKMITY